MTSKQYENLVAKVFQRQGYTTQIPSRKFDFGVNIIAKKEGKTVGIQVRKYNGIEQVNYRDILYLFAGARYLDCSSAVLVTDGTVMPQASEVARKLNIKIFENWMHRL